jgi:transposase
MTRAGLWVGLDVGADEMTVCVTDDQGAVLSEDRIPTKGDALHALLRSRKRRIRLIGLESGSFAIALVQQLRRRGYRVAMFEGRQASKFLAIRHNKTDRNDARGLADIARVGRDSVSEVRVKTLACQRLRSALVMRQRLLRLRMGAEGSMRSMFRLYGGRLKTSHSAAVLRKNACDEVRRLRKSANVDLTEDIEPLLSLSVALRSYLDVLDERLARRAKDEAVCSRFLEIPGVGPITALAFYSSIEEPGRFRRNADVGAYLGLVPRVRQSGQATARLRISKMGDKLTRTYLTTAAQQHLRYGDSALTIWAAGLSERLRKRGVQVAVARKLAVIMLAMWKSGQRYDPSHYSVTNTLPRGAAGRETATPPEDGSSIPAEVRAQPADTGSSPIAIAPT